MSLKYSQGIFIPKNPQKYAGRGSIRYRSSWELKFMNFLDENPSIKNWASESIAIPYKNPIENKTKSYVPDFFIVYEDINKKLHAEIVEIKPHKETSFEAAGKNTRNQVQAAINQAKWSAAKNFCDRQGMQFRIITENDMFVGTTKKKR